MVTLLLSSGIVFTDAYGQRLIGYSESITLTVKSDKTHCGSTALELTNMSVQSMEGSRVESAAAGSQVLVGVSVTSNCEIDNYSVLILFEVRDSEGITEYLALQNTTMSQGDRTAVGFSWLTDRTGDYQFRILAHACPTCPGDFGLVKVQDFSVAEQSSVPLPS